MGSHFILFWAFRVLKGKTKPKLGLYTKNIEKKEKKKIKKVNDMSKKFHLEKVNNWSTLVNGQITTSQWRSMVGERERGVTLVRVTLMWNLFVVAYQVCNIKNNIFPLSKSKFFFTLFVFFFNGDKRKCFLGSTFCAVSNIMKYGEKKRSISIF